MTRIGVLGAGSWGTTLADLLARKGHEVRLWAYEAEVVENINRGHVNELFLAGRLLDPRLVACSDPFEAVEGVPLILSAAPSHVVRAVTAPLEPGVGQDTILVSATKGIEAPGLCLPHEVLSETLPGRPVVALSGPSFAAEVHEGQPTAVVAAARDRRVSAVVQEAFSTPKFRVYSNDDLVGVELCGALKNVVAIAAGILEGLGLGNNPRAALITRGLAEMTRLGLAMGAQPMTFAGLAGMGDLILTATGGLSRNRALGLALAKGERLAEYTATHRTVAEGVNTARSAVGLAERHGVELPITAQVAAILFEDKSPRQAVTDLMERTLKAEQWR
jgi:glycerol-3-phosphate dehydrogenase (NAD(P)+)